MTDLLQLDPIAILVLAMAGGGVIYVVKIFTAAQTVREREMWAAVQVIMKDMTDNNNAWLEAFKSMGSNSNESIKELTSAVSAQNAHFANLRADINKSIENGVSLHSASKLMVDVLRAGNHRGSDA